MTHIVKILEIKQVTHDTKSFIIEKPKGYEFESGQATSVAINKPGFEDKKRPFTFASLKEDENIEMIIKKYKWITKELHDLEVGDELIIGEPWGAFRYKGEGVFIAGGAGITPFLSMFRKLKKENKIKGNILIYSNKEHEDIILEAELKEMLGEKAIFTLTRQKKVGYECGRIDEEMIKKYVKDFNQKFYVCGPINFVSDITHMLSKLGAKFESIMVEGA